MSQESAIYTLTQDDEHQVLPTLQEKCSHFQTAVPLSVSLAIKQNLPDVYCSFWMILHLKRIIIIMLPQALLLNVEM